MEDVFRMPYTLFIFTEKCNMRCTYCLEHQKQKKTVQPELLDNYLALRPFETFTIMGGEPFVEPDLFSDILDRTANDGDENNCVHGKAVITNGTVMNKALLETIARHKLHVQVSLDGPREVHDRNRRLRGNQSSFDRIMSSIEQLHKADIDWSLHGVVNRGNVETFGEILEFYTDLFLRYKDAKALSAFFLSNPFQFVFEEEWSDDDINAAIDGIGRFVDRLWQRAELSNDEKRDITAHLLYKINGACADVGTGTFAMNSDLDLFPCPRLATRSVEDKTGYCIGNVYHASEFENVEMCAIFYHQNCIDQKMYTAHGVLTQDDVRQGWTWQRWCSVSNLLTTGNSRYQSGKFTVLATEIDRFVVHLVAKFGLTPPGLKEKEAA